jgi:hypothetical protein
VRFVEPCSRRRRWGASIRGTVLGTPFNGTDAMCTNCGHGLNYVTVHDGAGSLCGGNAFLANSHYVLFNFGTANVGQTYTAPVDFVAVDGACKGVADVTGNGEVTVTGADANSVSGHFSATVGSNTVSGDFVAPMCAGPQTCM